MSLAELGYRLYDAGRKLDDRQGIKYSFNIVGDHTAHFWNDVDALSLCVHHIPGAQKEAVAVAWETGEPLKDPYVVKFPYHSHQACDYCTDGEYLFDGYTLTAVNACKYPLGIPVEIELDVPSGRVVIGNDYRYKFPGTGEDFSVNHASGIYGTIKDHEADKMAHFFVGNSCPGIFMAGENSLVIANHSDEIWDDEKGDYVPRENDDWPYGESVGSVCTDLWWVSMVDGDEADRRGLEYSKGSGKGWDDNEIFVTPGRYRITYNALLKGFNRDANTVIYATMEKIADE